MSDPWRLACFIDTKGPGGAERVVLDLAVEMSRRGYDVEVMHFGNRWIEERCEKAGVSTWRVPGETLYSSKWTAAIFAFRFAHYLRRRGIALLHSHLLGPVTTGAVAAMIAGIPHVGTLHDIHKVQEAPRQFGFVRVAAACGTVLVTVSEQMRGWYERLAKGRIRFERIYNGVEIDRFMPSGVGREGRFTVVAVGRLVEVKGFDLLIDAIARMERKADVALRIIGDGPLRQRLERLARERGVAQAVTFLGHCDEVAQLLAGADAFALASRSEGLSCSIVEAMAAGLPCLVTDVGGNRELVQEGVTGYVVPSGDAAAVARGLDRLAGEPEARRRMGRLARQRAERDFSLAASAEAYHQLYRSLLPGLRLA